ncbi:MAG: hypothetical protein U0136_15750 [Bdellovibrionota bacterium]
MSLYSGADARHLLGRELKLAITKFFKGEGADSLKEELRHSQRSPRRTGTESRSKKLK